MPSSDQNQNESQAQPPPINELPSNDVSTNLSGGELSQDQFNSISLDLVAPIGGGIGGAISSGLWLKEELEQRKALKSIDAHKKAMKDPVVAELVMRRESFADEIAAVDVAMDAMREHAAKTGMSENDLNMHLEALSSYRNDIDQHLTEIMNHPQMRQLRALEANRDLAKEITKRRNEHLLLNGGGLVRGWLSEGVSIAKSAVDIAHTAGQVSAPVAGVATAVAGFASVPLGTAQAVIGAAKTVNNVRDFIESGKIRDNAKAVRQEFADDPMLAAIAKRVQVKHEKNRYSHGLDAVANASSSLGGGIAAVGGVVTGTVGVAAGAGTMGAGTVAVATPFVIGAGVCTTVSITASAGNAAFKVARDSISKEKKQEVKEAMSCLHKLRSAGLKEFDGQSEAVKSILTNPSNIELASSGIKVDVVALKRPEEASVTLPDGSKKVLEGKGIGAQDTIRGREATMPDGTTKTLVGMGSPAKAKIKDSLAKPPGGGLVLTYQEIAGLKQMQDHAVKHWMRAAEPLVPGVAKTLAQAVVSENPDKYKSKSEVKKLEKQIASQLRVDLRKEAQQQFQDVNKLLHHSCEVMVARDTKTAMKYLAGQLRQDCGEAMLNRKMAGVVAADLPNSPSVNLARKLGMDDKQIARAATAVSHADTMKAGEKTLAKQLKLK